MPDANAPAFRIEASGHFIIEPANNPLWLWTDDPDGCPVVITESP